MIELLLQAERSLGIGALDQAERLYWQAIDADSQNAIAIVGLAKVAHLRGDDRTAIAFARRALKVDAENAVARRLVAELEAAHPEGVRAPVPTAEPVTPPVTAEAATSPAHAEPVTPVATDEPPTRSSAPPPEAAPAAAPATDPGSPPDPGIRIPRSERTDVAWPAADLKQVRRPNDR
jgi:hypothetical protein